MKPRNAYCSFCRKSHKDVGPLVEGPPLVKGPENVYICGACIELCQNIIDQERKRRNPTPSRATPCDAESIRKTLDALFPTWGEANGVVSRVAARPHGEQGRVLLVSPSQASAMLLAKAVAFALDAPFAAGDCVALGSVGEGSVILDLLDAAQFDIDSAQRGVICVSGIESVEGQDVLSELWQRNASNPVNGLTIDVQGILFVCCATFAALDDKPVNLSSLIDVGARLDWTQNLTGIARVPPLNEKDLTRLVNWADFPHGTTNK